MANRVFDYRLLRLIMGVIAFSLPVVVDLVATSDLSSISASYHTEARDVFVGLLFVVAALMLAYNGHNMREAMASKTAAMAAAGVALFPTAPPAGDGGWIAIVHYACAILLFCILAYFCFGPFRVRTKGRSGMKGRRARIYLTCGWVIVAAMAGLATVKILLPAATVAAYKMTYWAELAALWAFGIAWITAGKVLPFLVEPDEALRPLKGVNAA